MTASEISRPVDLRGIGNAPLELVASEEERAALAARFELVSVDALRATVDLDPRGGVVIATGTLDAQIVQSCAISGEDLPVTIAERLNIRFVPESQGRTPDEEIELDAEDCDEIEYRGTSFDLGEAVAQTLGLAIDPYLEGPGAEAARKAGLVSSEEARGAFAALAALRKG